MKFIRYELPFYVLKLLGIFLTAHILYVLLLTRVEPQLVITILISMQVLIFSICLLVIGAVKNLLQGKHDLNLIFQQTFSYWLGTNIFGIIIIHFV